MEKKESEPRSKGYCTNFLHQKVRELSICKLEYSFSERKRLFLVQKSQIIYETNNQTVRGRQKQGSDTNKHLNPNVMRLERWIIDAQKPEGNQNIQDRKKTETIIWNDSFRSFLVIELFPGELFRMVIGYFEYIYGYGLDLSYGVVIQNI